VKNAVYMVVRASIICISLLYGPMLYGPNSHESAYSGLLIVISL
jgi:uncharacterized protein YwgA